MQPEHRIYEIDPTNSPSALWNILQPPKRLYIQCKPEAFALLQQLPERGVAVVGTRYPHPKSLLWLRKWFSELQNTPLIILSGLALGIDQMAHLWALEFRLPTIAVLGCGLNHTYPPINRDLRRRVIDEGGIIVSEYEPDQMARKYQFLQRNRIIAAWAKATCVIEAGEKSGALNTAYWAREQNRQTFAVPTFPGDPIFAGNQTLLDRDHAEPLWGPHSLGSCWLELATLKKKNRRNQPYPLKVRILVSEIEKQTYLRGGMTLFELLEWSSHIGWERSEFFEYYQNAITADAIQERLGILVYNPKKESSFN